MMDLFEHFDVLPIEVKEILDGYNHNENTYDNCAELVSLLNTVGYTCDYGLDAEPYGLRKLSMFDEWEADKIDKVFNAVTDEMSYNEAESLKEIVRTREEKICYFIEQEEKFKNYFL